MNPLLEPEYYSLEEYYAVEKASDRRFEYWNGQFVCLSGGTKEHGQNRFVDNEWEKRVYDCLNDIVNLISIDTPLTLKDIYYGLPNRKK